MSTSRPQTVRLFIASFWFIVLSLAGIWEVFRGGAHRPYLLLLFLGLLLSGLVVLGSEFLNTRELLREAHQSHDRKHDLAEAQRLGHVGSWECDADGSNRHWSEELYRIYGLDPVEPAPDFQNLQKLYPPGIWDRVLDAMESRTLPEMDMERVCPDGTRRWIRTRFDVTRDSDGAIVKLRGISRDITEEKETADQLRESEERFRRVVDHIGDAVFADDIEGRAVFANDRFLSLFGFCREQLPSLRLEDLAAPEYRAEVRDRHDRRMRGESVATNFEYQGIRLDGMRIWVEVDVVPIVDQQGKITGTQSALRDITERKRARQAIYDSEQRLRDLIEASNDWVWETNRDGRFTYASAQCRELLGYEPEELMGKLPIEIMKGDEGRRISDITNRVFTERKPFSGLQGASLRKDGKLVVWEANGIPVFDQTGEFCGYRGLVRNITERHRAEMELRESEERFRRVVEHIRDALVVDDVAGRVVFANDQFLTLFGFHREKLDSVKLEDYVAPRYRKELRDEHTRRMNGEELGSRYEFEGIRLDGNHLWIEAQVVSIKDHEGKLVGSQRVLRDITEQTNAEQAVLESEERLRHLISSSNDWVWEMDSNAVYTYAGPQCMQILGYQPAEIIGKTRFELMPKDEGLRVASLFTRIAAERNAFRGLRNVNLHKNGTLVVLETNGVPILDAEGNFCGYRGMDRDITERDRAEQALRESEERFRLVANTAPVMIWMSRTDKRGNYFNRPWLDFTGTSLASQLGDGWLKWVHPEDASSRLQSYVKAFDHRKPFEIQYRLRRHDGEYRWVLDFGVPRFNSDGSFAGYIGSCIDITERKQAEEALATIGRRLIEAHEEERTWIGRELHDDINQRLALLSVELDRWLKDHPSRAPIRELIHHAQQRITEVARDVQGLSHRLHSSKLEYLGLAKAASSFCKELSKHSNVKVSFRDAGIPRILPREISLCLFRVLQEALQNAVKHSGVQSFSVDLYGSSDEIELTVEDSGIGFDPGEALVAQGIGLISMRERLQLVHGELSIQSKRGRGTTIHASVPLQEAASQALAG